jgi:hypothetical protein
MSMKRRLGAMASIGFVIAAVTAFTIAPAAPAAPPSTGGLTFPISVTGTCTGVGAPSTLCTAAGQTLSFTGTGTVTNFSVVNGVLTAAGTYTGTLTNLNDPLVAAQTVTGSFSAPVSGGTGSCQILDLTIGPINLDLLGLVVQTNQIHLQITAQQGPGNLLGNLLCAVANLLNGNTSSSALQQLANLLNQLLGGL